VHSGWAIPVSRVASSLLPGCRLKLSRFLIGFLSRRMNVVTTFSISSILPLPDAERARVHFFRDVSPSGIDIAANRGYAKARAAKR